MFNPGLGAIPNAAKQRAEVRRIVFDHIGAGTFTYSELLSAEEPWRTMALEALDGVTVQGSKPSYNGEGVEDWGGRPFRLIHIAPEGRIKVAVAKQVRVPGSDVTKVERFMDDVGNIADVHDQPHNRQARQILFQHGWPVRQTVSKGNSTGTVVEWNWLVQEASRGDQAKPGVLDLFEELSERMKAWEAAKAAGASAKAEASAAQNQQAMERASAAVKRKNQPAAPAQP